MDFDRETVVEIVAAVVPVLLLLVGLAVIGQQYATNGDLSATGGKILVGAIVAFVGALAGVGLYLSRLEY